MAVTQALRPRRAETMSALPITAFPSYVHHRQISTAETETAPAGAELVVISSDTGIWLSGGSAQVPSTDVTDGTGSFFMAAGQAEIYTIKAGQTLSLVAASGTANVSFRYYAWDDLG